MSNSDIEVDIPEELARQRVTPIVSLRVKIQTLTLTLTLKAELSIKSMSVATRERPTQGVQAL